MKIKFGGIFLIIFTCIFMATGFYFLKPYPIFSSIFFIASVINIILIYKEHHNGSKVTSDPEYAPEELKIKYSLSLRIINMLTYLIFLAVAIFGLVISQDQLNLSNKSVFTVMALFFIIFIAALSLEIKKANGIFISINNEGIQFQNNPRIHWGNIQQEKIISKYVISRDSRHESRTEINYLYFFNNTDKVEIEIDELDIDSQQLSRFLKIYRKRYETQHSLS